MSEHEWFWLRSGWCITRHHCGPEDIANVAEHGDEAPTVSRLNLLWCPDDRPNWMNGSRVAGL